MRSFPVSHIEHQGFTLVELAIVLVIIGLLIGGVLVGSALIRTAELQSAVQDKDRLVTAVNIFRDKYGALPGDMGNATDYWGTASGGCPNGVGTGTQTCNGNSDGLIYDYKMMPMPMKCSVPFSSSAMPDYFRAIIRV
jgi:prepilin-type N-terminal cleavage/methylation domain-containing protein